MSAPFFSVIVAAHNQQEFIGRTVESILAQSFRDFEIIVVDDGSTDHTVQRVLAGGGPVKLLQKSNGGPGSARNHALRKARGRYVVFLDGDDLWFPWTLSCFHDGLRQHPDCEWIIGRCLQFFGDTDDPICARELGGQRAKLSFVRRGTFLDTAVDYFEIYTGEFAVLRQKVVEVGGYCQEMMNLEDGDLYLRLGAELQIIEVVSPPVLAYRRRLGSTSGNLDYALRACAKAVERERLGIYPGGRALERARLRILTRYIRPVVIRALKEERLSAAWSLYRLTWKANLRLGRLKYLIGVAFLLAAKGVTKIPRQENGPNRAFPLNSLE